jgi:hypothetical protein
MMWMKLQNRHNWPQQARPPPLKVRVNLFCWRLGQTSNRFTEMQQ